MSNEQTKPAMVTMEVLRYGVTDSEGDRFERGCFGEVEGIKVPVEYGGMRVSYAVLHDTEDALTYDIPQIGLAYAPDGAEASAIIESTARKPLP